MILAKEERSLGKIHLVTEIVGFIDSHVAGALLQQGDMVIGIDHTKDYYDPTKKYDNLEVIQDSVKDVNQFTFYEGGIRNQFLLNQIFLRFRFASIVHPTAMAGVRASIEDSHYYYDVDLLNALNLLDKARDLHVPKVLFKEGLAALCDWLTGHSNPPCDLQPESCL
jgi:nucleoside-diphosphate-sugar epimerase